LDLLLAEAGRG